MSRNQGQHSCITVKLTKNARVCGKSGSNGRGSTLVRLWIAQRPRSKIATGNVAGWLQTGRPAGIIWANESAAIFLPGPSRYEQSSGVPRREKVAVRGRRYHMDHFDRRLVREIGDVALEASSSRTEDSNERGAPMRALVVKLPVSALGVTARTLKARLYADDDGNG